MFGLSMGHLLILFFIILLFQARRLPELGNALGKGIRAFKDGLEGKQEAQRLEDEARLAAETKADGSLNSPLNSSKDRNV